MIFLNQKSRTLRLTRGELCDLLLILAVQDGRKWQKLHVKLKEQLDKQDEKDPDFPKE